MEGGGEKREKKTKKKPWRNVTIQRSFSWRGGDWCEGSYSGTPSSLETLDQNGRLRRRALHFFLFIYSPRCPSLISCTFEALSRPIKLSARVAPSAGSNPRLSHAHRVISAPSAPEVRNLPTRHKLEIEAGRKNAMATIATLTRRGS